MRRTRVKRYVRKNGVVVRNHTRKVRDRNHNMRLVKPYTHDLIDDMKSIEDIENKHTDDEVEEMYQEIKKTSEQRKLDKLTAETIEMMQEQAKEKQTPVPQSRPVPDKLNADRVFYNENIDEYDNQKNTKDWYKYAEEKRWR